VQRPSASMWSSGSDSARRVVAFMSVTLGLVYQKDLGKKTGDAGKTMRA